MNKMTSTIGIIQYGVLAGITWTKYHMAMAKFKHQAKNSHRDDGTLPVVLTYKTLTPQTNPIAQIITNPFLKYEARYRYKENVKARLRGREDCEWTDASYFFFL